jgi:hypothetical protein
LSRLNYQLDQHLTSEEIRHLRESRLKVLGELFQVSVQLHGEHSLSESDIEELRAGSGQGDLLLNFMMRFTAQGNSRCIDRDQLAERERQLLKEKGVIEERLSGVKVSRRNRSPLSPEEIAQVRRERDKLRRQVEALLTQRDFYLERVVNMRLLASRGKSERIYETLARLERHTHELPATRTLRMLADLLTNTPVNIAQAETLVRQCDNDVFLQMILVYHDSFIDDTEGVASRSLIAALLAKHSTFRHGLLEDTEAFFRSKAFRRDRELHSIVLFNPSAPVILLRHVLRVPLRDLEAAKERARRNYGSEDILDVLTEIARATSDRTRLRHILQITAKDPIRRVRFERVLSYRPEIGKKGVLALRPRV